METEVMGRVLTEVTIENWKCTNFRLYSLWFDRWQTID